MDRNTKSPDGDAERRKSPLERSQTSAVQVNVIFLISKVSGEKDKLRQDKFLAI